MSLKKVCFSMVMIPLLRVHASRTPTCLCVERSCLPASPYTGLIYTKTPNCLCVVLILYLVWMCADGASSCPPYKCLRTFLHKSLLYLPQVCTNFLAGHVGTATSTTSSLSLRLDPTAREFPSPLVTVFDVPVARMRTSGVRGN